jgi:hypothetical protein
MNRTYRANREQICLPTPTKVCHQVSIGFDLNFVHAEHASLQQDGNVYIALRALRVRTLRQVQQPQA